MELSHREPTELRVESDIENPLNVAEDFPTFDGYDDDDDDENNLDRIGRNSFADMTDTIQHRRKPKKPQPQTVIDHIYLKSEKVVRALEYRDLSRTTKVFLVLMILPIALFCLLKQLRVFLILAVFNYSGVNLRPYLFFDISTERDIMRIEENFKGGPLTLSKVFYVSQRYMTYWVVVIVLIIATPFINEVDRVDFLHGYEFFEGDAALNYLLQVVISIAIGFANIIPSKAVRPDISLFLSSFTEQDYTIRDSPHTRLKDISEVLNDIKVYGFALLHTDMGSPIIVSTMVPEELRLLDGFKALLSIDTFDNNQILRFILIERDVDSFFVLQNDVGMCHRVDFDPHLWSNVLEDLSDFKLRVEISNVELSLYGGASLVLLVVLFGTTQHLHVTAILIIWVTWPVVFAILYRKRKSKLASINFFTLDGKDRKYQPYNNVCVSSDDVIMERIHNFKFFKALFKFTLQGKYLIHTLLKATENCGYNWLDVGLKMKDFKRFAALAAVTYERDVGIISPNAKMLISAPRRHNDMCVVCSIQTNGEITSLQMTRAQFDKASQDLPFGDDIASIENMYFK